MIKIPTIKDLYEDVMADLESKLEVTIPLFGPVFLRALAAVQAAKLKLFYLMLGKVQKNVFADSADAETLVRFGMVKLNRAPFAATQGRYSIAITGTTGATIPANSIWKSNDDSQNPGKLFILDQSHTMEGGTDSVAVRALEAGLESRLYLNEFLTATAPIAGVDDTAIVIAEVETPQSEEDIEDYREKVLAAYRLEPQGGAASDYRLWSFDAQGVKQAYPFAKSGAPGEINVYIEANVDDSIDGYGTPSGTILTDVAAVIEQDPDTTKSLEERGRRPLGVVVNVLPVTPRAVDITISGFVDLTTDKETTITNALREAISDIRPFVSGADVLTARNDTLGQNNIINIILNAVPGAVFSSATFKIDNVGYGSYQFVQGNIPYLNTVTIS